MRRLDRGDSYRLNSPQFICRWPHPQEATAGDCHITDQPPHADLPPLVDSADTVLELTVTEPNESTSIVVDGRILSRLLPGDRVRIERAQQTFQMLAVSGHDDYRALRDKLGWADQFQ